LPVVGLDASGTRDLVVDSRTGLLLRTDNPSEWNDIFADPSSIDFEQAAVGFSHLLEQLVFDTDLRKLMSRRAIEEGTIGRSWEQAMNAMVDCYREVVAISRDWQPTASRVHRRPSARWHLPFKRYIFIVFFIFLIFFGIAYRFLLLDTGSGN
jgi:hypothetical protein